MITPLSLKLLGFSVKLAHAVRISPYQWNDRQRSLKKDTSKFHRALWRLISCLMTVNQVIMLARVSHRLFDPDISSEVRILPVVHLIIYSLFTIMVYMLNVHEGLVLQWANQSLGLFSRAQEEYLTKAIRRKNNVHKLFTEPYGLSHAEVLMVLLSLTPFTLPVLAVGPCFAFSDGPGFIGSLFPQDESFPWYLFLGASIEYYIQTYGLSSFSMFGNLFLIFVPNLVFWLSEIRFLVACGSTKFTIDKLREPPHALSMYRSLQIIVRLTNQLIAAGGVEWVHTAFIILAIISNVIIIRLHRVLSFFTILIFMIILIVVILFLALSHIMLGKATKCSAGFVGSWKSNRGNMGRTGADRALMMKYIKSCRVLAFNISSYGSFLKLGALRQLGRVVGYTVKMLVTFKKQ